MQYSEQPQGAELGERGRTKKTHTMVGEQDYFVAFKATVNHLCSYKESMLFSNGKESVGVHAYTYGIVL